MSSSNLLNRYFIFSLFILSCTLLKSQNSEKVSDAVKITNFIQLYHGYETRLPWHNNEIKHYVYKDNDGVPEWLFDGFLFLEIYADFGDKRYDYGALMPGKLAPGKEVWENLICKTFEDTRGPNALESVLDSLALKGHIPPYRRTVVFTLPNPIFGTVDWGFVEGKALDFTKIEDRFIAAKWYISRILDEWQKREYKHINFGGFYWQHEGIDFDNDDHLLVQMINEHLRSMQINSYWLPHYGANGVDEWKTLGFSYAYEQPNYYFYPDGDPKMISNTVKKTKDLDMGIMLEFDHKVIDQPDPYKKSINLYIDEFEKGGIWESGAVNFYDGADGWYRLATSEDIEAKKMYNKLCRIISKRNGLHQ